MTLPDTKYCSRGKHSPLRSEFGDNIHTPDGKQAWCKACSSAYAKAHKAAKQAARSRAALDWSRA